MGSIINLFPHSYPYKPLSRKYHFSHYFSDIEAMCSDWNQVGKDIGSAISLQKSMKRKSHESHQNWKEHK